MREILVIRFGALGDLCVLGWALARLADLTGGADRVTLATKAAFAPLLAAARGVDEVRSPETTDLEGMRRFAADLRRTSWDLVLDAHGTLRSHLLLGLLGRRPDARLAKDTAARLAFMRFKRPSPRLALSMHDRFGAVLAPVAPVDVRRVTAPPLAGLRPGGDRGPVLGLAPGARWDTKRWPEERFAALLEAHLQASGGPVRIFLGPQEDHWFAASRLAAVAAAAPANVDIVRGQPLLGVAASLTGLGVLVTNDSGLLHLAEAVGTPVVALFGPTVREFGYFPCLPQSRVCQTELACRPCSRNGKRPCHRGDLACLARIEPDEVLAAATAVLREGACS